jgi:hypothetical protein
MCSVCGILNHEEIKRKNRTVNSPCQQRLGCWHVTGVVLLRKSQSRSGLPDKRFDVIYTVRVVALTLYNAKAQSSSTNVRGYQEHSPKIISVPNISVPQRAEVV